MQKIPFNRSVLIPNQERLMLEVLRSGDTSGNGLFGKKCEQILSSRTFKPVRLVSSGTAALEMMALLLDIQSGDEVILPSFTFSSTANAFALRGARLRFADNDERGNIRLDEVERLFSKKTKAVMVVHYAGASPDMDSILDFCKGKGITLVEDAAQAIGANYKNRPLGTIGDLGCYSFHETKNISAGEGGALLIGEETYLARTEILREKGTNRSAFFQGLVDKYSWVDIGSSYILSELNASYLLPQLEEFESIQEKRKELWKYYEGELEPEIGRINGRVLKVPTYNTPNYHMFALIFASGEQRNAFIQWMKDREIICPFHYIPLHSAPQGRKYYEGKPDTLPMADKISQCLVRLPLFYNLTGSEIERVVSAAKSFLTKQ